MSLGMSLGMSPLVYLRSPRAIRERCRELFDLATRGELAHFTVHLDRLDEVVKLVKEETLKNYPTLDVPYHSRWRHFDVGGVDRNPLINEMMKRLSPLERCRSKLELAIVSVLLDAGAGDTWSFLDPSSGQSLARSEGLAVASLCAFGDGVFGPEPWMATSDRLRAITQGELGEAFQVSTTNPLLGVEGRCSLLNSLGQVIDAHADEFSGAPGRLGGILELILERSRASRVEASDLLSIVLTTFADIWPGRLTVAGENLGDVWTHPKVDGEGATKGLVPFHKLSQWMTYSLLEPLEELGIEVVGLNALTGLAEYRNGGLFLDTGVISLKDPSEAQMSHSPASEVIVEWRALTIILLDLTAVRLREMLGKSEVEFPLAKMLQGGTWSVGRQLARERRPGGGPPLSIASDGTVF